MVRVGFREYDLESDDFPIHIAVESQDHLFVLADIEFQFAMPAEIIVRVMQLQAETPHRKALDLERPVGFTAGDITFTILVAFPPGYPIDQPHVAHLESADHQNFDDRIWPDDITPVWANFQMHLHS